VAESLRSDDSEPGGLKGAITVGRRKTGKDAAPVGATAQDGMQKLSRTDEDATVSAPAGQSFELGYTAEIAVSDDHLIWRNGLT